MKDLSQLQKLNDFIDDAAFIRDVSKVKQVRSRYLLKLYFNLDFILFEDVMVLHKIIS